MSDQETLPKKAKKFFFDQNNFDDDFIEEVIEETPPPPVFSEEELDAARKDAFARGKNEGLAEAAASREKFIADLLQKIATDFSRLFSQEDARAALYEQESVMLARAVLDKLFPALNQKHGITELEAVIKQVLESQKTHAEIFLEVHPDYMEAIKDYVQKTVTPLQSKTVCTVTGNETLEPGDIRMNWKDGGALRDSKGLAEEISRQLELVLADQPAVRDNIGNDSPDPATVHEGENKEQISHADSPATANVPETEIKDE